MCLSIKENKRKDDGELFEYRLGHSYVFICYDIICLA